MMKVSRRFLFVGASVVLASLITVIIVFSLVSLKKETQASGKHDGSERLILGFSQIGSESAWRTRNTQSIFEAAEKNNIQILFDDAQQKQENQLKAIRSFIVYQVDVIAFVPIVEDGWDNVLKEAKEAGIPVIIVDRRINADESLYAGFLGENGFIEGFNAANFLLEKTKGSDSTVNILEVCGTHNSSVATERADGFRSVIAGNDRYKIIRSIDGDFLRSRGKEIMDEIIDQNNGLMIDGMPVDVIYSHNDSMTLGMLDSFAENIISTKDTIIISIDAEQKSIDALVEGKLNCVIECNPNLGDTLMQLVMDIHAGKEIPRTTYMTEKVFTENDDFSTYTPRGY